MNIKRHEFIYFYMDGRDQVPIMTGDATELHSILFISDDEKRKMLNDRLLPDYKSLYVMIDDKIFRVWKGKRGGYRYEH